MNNKDTEKTVRTAIRNTRKEYRRVKDAGLREALATRHRLLTADLRHIMHCTDSRYCGWHA